MLRTSLLSLTLLSPLAGTGLADTLTVPGDAPNLAQAIALAMPGDEILVQTIFNQNGDSPLAPIVVDKPLTIRGEIACLIEVPFAAGFPNPGISLIGPGSGRVVLENVVVQYGPVGASGGSIFTATGFDELVLRNCLISQGDTVVDGIIDVSAPAMELTGIDRLELVDSQILGGDVGLLSCLSSASTLPNGGPAIVGLGTEVCSFGSTIEGGRGGFTEVTAEPCPSSLDMWPGKAGAGLIASSLFSVASAVTGGEGATWLSNDSGSCFGGSATTPCGQQPDGPATVLGGANITSSLGLVEDIQEVSLSTGGVQSLEVIAEPALAGSVYLVLGSFSGSSPGLPLAGFTLPLATPDPYFDYSFRQANGPVLQNTLGFLSPEGRATAMVTLTPALPLSLVGTTATHAAVMLDAALLVTGVSNPTTLTIGS